MKRVSDLFERALRRSHVFVSSGNGSPIVEQDGAQVSFFVEIAEGLIRRVDYRCTTCVTLVAACEAVVEVAAGKPVSQALDLTAETLLDLVPGVPAQRHSRFQAAIRAFRAAC